MFHRCLLALAVTLVAPAIAGAQAAKSGDRVANRARSPVSNALSEVTAFVNVGVVPMDTERVLLNQTVLVEGGRITVLGPTSQVRVPAGATRIDGQGKYLIPGLADMHAHVHNMPFAAKRLSMKPLLYAYAANGVTTIRVMGYETDSVLIYRAQAAAGELVSPRIYAAAGPMSKAEDVLPTKAAGYDLIKLYGVKGARLDSIVATARRVGIPLAGHAPTSGPLGLDHAIAAGYASIEHLTQFEQYLGASRGVRWWHYWGMSGGAKPQTFSPAEVRQLLADSVKLRAMAAALQRAGVWNCPTLAMYEAGLLAAADRWPEMQYVPDSVLANWRQVQAYYHTPIVRPSAEAAMDVKRAIVKTLHQAGAGLLLGTDSEVPFMLHGFAVHRELEAFVRAGLSPYDALVTGTRNVAGYFGTLDSTGTVAVGKRADLVLLRGNPLQDIRHTQQPAGVLLGGRWLDRVELERGLAGLKGQLPLMTMPSAIFTREALHR